MSRGIPASMPPVFRLAPPLPDPIEVPASPSPLPCGEPSPMAPPDPVSLSRRLRSGCYLIEYALTAHPRIRYDGTLRVESNESGRTASGDLYQRSTIVVPQPLPKRPAVSLGPGPDPAAGIPIFPRDRYRYYLRVTQIREAGSGVTLVFEMHRFDLAAPSWTDEGAFTALMAWTPAPQSYPSTSDFLTGDVKNAANTVVGKLTLGWLTRHLRKATIEIDRVAASEAPLDNGAGLDWKGVGNAITWDLTVDVSDTNVVEPSGEFWSDAELHAVLLARREATNLDTEWHYHVLAVRRLKANNRGIMYDRGSVDGNNVPREGCALASHWVFDPEPGASPNQPDWGLVKGVRMGQATGPYFRTAVHEMGHCMGLWAHNPIDNGFMNDSPAIAASATPTNPFPHNIQWRFAPDDAKRLRHMPDVHVRPGGTPHGWMYSQMPLSPTDQTIEDPGCACRCQRCSHRCRWGRRCGSI